MNRTAKITNIIEKRQPLANKIEEVKQNLNDLSSTINHLEEYRQKLLDKVDEPSITGRLKEINFSEIRADILSELQALIKLKTRFSRDTLNIGVIGRARQGKSRLLQSLTGLTKAEIPDGSVNTVRESAARFTITLMLRHMVKSISIQNVLLWMR